MKEFSTEQRLLLALGLSVLLVAITDSLLLRRTPPRTPAPAVPAASPRTPAPAAAPAAAPAPVPPGAQHAATSEQTLVVENDLYRVVLSNRGGVVRSWQLKRFQDNAHPPHTLDVVHSPPPGYPEEWPLSLLLVDTRQQTAANTALYEVTPAAGTLRPPVEVRFLWSDGHLAVSKRLQFGTDYVVTLDAAVTLDGQPVPFALAWRGGFGDPTADNASLATQVFYFRDGRLTLLPLKKLGSPDHPEQPAPVTGPLALAGIEDQYFAAAFLPAQNSLEQLWHWRSDLTRQHNGTTTTETVPEVAVGTGQPATLRLYVGPKALDELGRVNPSLRQLVQYGWFGFIAEPLFYILQFIHRYIPNYGWAIVVLTVLINMALFPLKVSSWRSMQKMQRVMPEIRAIQNRYKKYPLRDPRRQKMNEEMMEIYRREGINPLGGCLPMLLQMPIWIALYRMLGVAIELRHAPWFGWIRDLSAHDPYYILPVAMTATMYLMQKMTPSTTPDPAQQKMMNLMPLFFGVLFLKISSGLVVYILASNLVGMAQQWYLNKTNPLRPQEGRRAPARAR